MPKNTKKMKKNILGIIVKIRSYGEKDLLINILLENDMHVRGYLRNLREKKEYDQNVSQNYCIGMQVMLCFYQKDGEYNFGIDSVENSLVSLFWNDGEKLSQLNCLLDSVSKIHLNAINDNLYENFLNAVKAIAKGDNFTIDKFSNSLIGL